MKKRTLLLAILSLLGISSFAWDFEVDGIYYNVLSLDDLTVEVTYNCDKWPDAWPAGDYTGDIVVPKTVEYRDHTFSVVSIGEYAFRKCDKLTSVTLNDNIKKLDYCAFAYCSALTELILPDSLSEIGSYAISRCYNLADITIPEKVEVIDTYAFYESTNLSSVTFNGSIRILKSYAFGKTSIKSIRIPASVQGIAEHCFSHCAQLSDVCIENSSEPLIVPSVNPFDYCPLENFYLGRNCNFSGFFSQYSTPVTTIRNLTVGENVADLSWIYFDDIQSISFLSQVPPKVEYTFTNKQYMDVLIVVPTGSMEVYQSSEPWKHFWNISESSFASVDRIGNVTSPVETYDINGIQTAVINGIKIIRTQDGKTSKVFLE